ncbi:hypothetical protein DC083_07010 [Ignatzschineria ureiclastica]|uniref:Hemerythrin-like domain-containing protein n=1 Tax=Ignatzschineria ureiclastica TaxID=472582 RepID=A0A2U2ADW7_9GAMM|nr:hypothetical protein [Ignatzschineria ureiclastica]PWD80850.1 hypothetical protein DC083_07010 [Ignatzschineria ureiclastica]GGZ94363.1 hypothetical protein GCM10007162_07540 [Ignatzschineria ureiclastica]
MKRDPRLIPFSKEHHQTLKLGNYLRRLTEIEADPAITLKQIQALLESANRAVNEDRASLLNHFAEEERLLQPILDQWSDQHFNHQFQAEHQQLRQILLRNEWTLNELIDLGTLLIAHTRFEERSLFPAIENYWALS